MTLVVGWVEDLAAGRRPALAPVSSGTAHTAVILSVVVALTVVAALVAVGPWAAAHAGHDATPAVYQPRLPSQQPPLPSFVPEDLSKPAPTPDSGVSIAQLPAVMTTVMNKYRDDQGAPGVAIAVRSLTSGLTWSGAVGSTLEGTPMAVDDSIDTASVTKVFTATLVMQAVDRGLIDLDAPLPQLEAVPNFPYSDILTPRLLLQHRSGLVDYRATDEWTFDQSTIDSPEAAVAAAGNMSLLFEPGAEVRYSSVNFLVLGLLLEQVTGRSYDELVTDSILRPLHLTHTTHLAPEPGAPHGGAAGIVSTLPDLLVAADGLLKHHSFVSDAAWNTMAGFDLFTGLGAGIAGYCPCTVTADGAHKFFSVGFTGSSTFLAYVPSLDIAVSIEVGDDLSTLPGRFVATTNLIQDLAATLAAAH